MNTTEWMPRRDLAEKLGVTTSQLTTACTSGYRCGGMLVEERPATDDDRTRWGKTSRTKYMFRAIADDELVSEEIEAGDRAVIYQAKIRELEREVASLRETAANLRRSPDGRELTLLRKFEENYRELLTERAALEYADGEPWRYIKRQVERCETEVRHTLNRLDDLRSAERRAS